MAKISFVKIENLFDEALRKILIDHLSELSTIVSLIQNPDSSLDETSTKKILDKFRSELEKLKKKELKLYEKLELSQEEENRFFDITKKFNSEDWNRLKLLRDRIDELKKELYGEITSNEQFDQQVENERTKHKNKRFNVKESWLPLD